MVRLSDHRPLAFVRNAIRSKVSNSNDFCSFSTSCRLGSSSQSTLILAQACFRDSKKLIHSGNVSFDMKVTLQKDMLGQVRRDTQEEKQFQV